MPRKRRKKKSPASLKNLVPGNLQHGAYLFRRTGQIPAEHADIADEAQRFGKRLREEYCQPGNFILNRIQTVPIRQVVSDFVFSELLITRLWQQVGRASPDGMGAVLALPGWMTWLSASNRIGRGFRHLNRNLRDFRFDKGKNTSLDDYLEHKYGDKGRK